MNLLWLLLWTGLTLFCLGSGAVLFNINIHNSVNELGIKSSRRYTHQIGELKLIGFKAQLKRIDIVKYILFATTNPNINLPSKPGQIPINRDFNPLELLNHWGKVKVILNQQLFTNQASRRTTSFMVKKCNLKNIELLIVFAQGRLLWKKIVVLFQLEHLLETKTIIRQTA